MDRRVLIALLAVPGILGGCGYPTYSYVEDDAVVLGDDGLPIDGDVDGSKADGGPGDDVCVPNGCGGCETVGVKGDRCGDPCGQYQCDGTEVKCVQSTPAPGTACGICKSSKYTCTALGESKCANIDDRTVIADVDFENKTKVVFTLDHTTEVVATYASTKPVTYADAAFYIRRIPYVCPHVTALPNPDPACTDCKAASGGGFDCTIPSTLMSDVTVTLYKGSPATTLTPVASGKLANAAEISPAGKFETVTFVMEAPPEVVGTTMSVGITTTSTAYAFEISGADSPAFPPAPAGMTWSHRKILPTAGAWTEEPASDTALVVHGKACP